ncbi:transferase [Aureococcus anophagefferens]|nr:transferase [Aureococcus anophagefferens]KAH8075140.1 transferase [Aureococcus anophagefferens]KAH8076986.1 transferase [Aureococcus anophagefferens]
MDTPLVRADAMRGILAHFQVVAAGGYENLVRAYRRVLTGPRGCLTRYLRQRFGRDAPHDVAARVLEFWKPPGGP